MVRDVAMGALVCLLSATLVAAPRLDADAYQDRRIETGLRLFRALLAADLDLEKKAEGGKLLVLFFYTDDKRHAEEMAKAFAQGEGAEAIHGLPVVVETTSDASFKAYGGHVPAGVFLTQSPDAEALRAIVKYGIANHRIVDSPFEGHVESGVLGGLAVEAQVRPYINGATLVASSITLKEFFLRVTKVYK